MDTRLSNAINALKDHELDWLTGTSAMQEPLFVGATAEMGSSFGALGLRILAVGVVAVAILLLTGFLLTSRQDAYVTDHFRAEVATPDATIDPAIDVDLDAPLPDTAQAALEEAAQLQAKAELINARIDEISKQASEQRRRVVVAPNGEDLTPEQAAETAAANAELDRLRLQAAEVEAALENVRARTDVTHKARLSAAFWSGEG